MATPSSTISGGLFGSNQAPSTANSEISSGTTYKASFDKVDTSKLNYTFLKGKNSIFMYFPLVDAKYNFKDLMELHLLNFFFDEYSSNDS